MPIPRPCRSLPSRPLPSRPRRFPDSRQPMRRSLTAPPPDPALDEIAARVTGAMVNAGIASIDDLWSRGQPLAQPLATYTWLARAASRRHTAGLWTLIAWIHWRGNDRQAAWPALHLALDIDPGQDPPTTSPCSCTTTSTRTASPRCGSGDDPGIGPGNADQAGGRASVHSQARRMGAGALTSSRP